MVKIQINLLFFSMYLTLFIYGNIVVIGEFHSTDCPIGVSDTNFIWGVAFILLIFSYLGIGLPIGLMILYVLFIGPFILCYGIAIA